MLEMLFFLCYAYITHIFGLRQTQLNGIISSPYPQVTLDAFGFPVDARLFARQAVFWHRLPKMDLFGANNARFWSEMCCMLFSSIVWYCIAFHCIVWYILLPYGIVYWIVLHCISLYCMVSYFVLWYPIPLHGIACYCVVGFGARAVSRKTPLYFMASYGICRFFRCF